MFCRVCDIYFETKCWFKCFLPFVSIFQFSNMSIITVFEFTMRRPFFTGFVMCSIWPFCWIILLICRNLVVIIIQSRFRRSRAIRISSDFLVWLMWQGKLTSYSRFDVSILSHFAAIFVGLYFCALFLRKKFIVARVQNGISPF